ncbi:hypothetical protein R9C00_16395 [Flammeovirgaceae bacterium SG7u.111]|nr:hypothetical protein [Flammeovirgaceae bacterium SG7u.132]WPO33283.1 hypothetical protein R9C00_16395 [Flammeovirgaceae bacterium SG7u.111]
MKNLILSVSVFALLTIARTIHAQSTLEHVGPVIFRSNSSTTTWTGTSSLTLAASKAQNTGLHLSYSADGSSRMGRILLNNNWDGTYGDFAITLRNQYGTYDVFKVFHEGKVNIRGNLHFWDGLLQLNRTYEGSSNVLTFRTKDNNEFGDFRFEAENTGTGSVRQLLFINGLNGNLGIGTETPEYKLDVRGDLYINSGNGNNHIYWASHQMTMGTRPNDYAHNYFKLKPGGSSQGLLASVFQMYEAKSETSHELKLELRSTGTSFFNGGNVGIGTTNPEAMLTVAGEAHARKVKVTVNAGADFVFAEDYDLPNLNKVAEFVKNNKHLPEIPSEKEMRDNGLDLGEMDIKLLQKVEELTLYLIQQQKDMEALKKENQSLKQRLEKLENK